MNNKGFTLVELLAVIVILSLIALLASTSVTKVLKESKDELSGIQLGEIKEAAETWSMDNLNKLPGNGECAYITVEDLKEYGVLDTNINNPKNNKQISNDLKIKITSNTGKDGNLITNYEVDSKNVSNCKYIYEPIVVAATKENKTLAGTVPQGKFAKGDEYIVNVDGTNKYHFYVLSVEKDKVNLIMSNSICSNGTIETSDNICTVAWYGDYMDNTKGPITAMNAIYSATDNWSNVPRIKLNYTDAENISSHGYGGIKSLESTTSITEKDGIVVTTYENLRTRLPMKLEIESTGCTSESGSCPAWLVNGLTIYTPKYPEGTKEDIDKEGVYGYWSLSSNNLNAGEAWFVYYSGTIGSGSVSNANSYGIRPVIELPKSYFR